MVTRYHIHFRIPYFNDGKKEKTGWKVCNTIIEEDTEEEEPEDIEETEEQEPSAPDTSIDTLDDCFALAVPIQIGRGRPKQPKNTKTNKPGETNLKIYVENINEDQLQQAIETINENPNKITSLTTTVMMVTII